MSNEQSNNDNDKQYHDNIIRVSDDKITIDIERMIVERIYPCIYKDRVLLFIKDDEGNFNCYEVSDEDLKSKIRCNPDHDYIVRLLNAIISK